MAEIMFVSRGTVWKGMTAYKKKKFSCKKNFGEKNRHCLKVLKNILKIVFKSYYDTIRLVEESVSISSVPLVSVMEKKTSILKNIT